MEHTQADPSHEGPSFAYAQGEVMMGSTASFVGMLKAAALSNFQSLDQTVLDEDLSSPRSTESGSGEEVIDDLAATESVSDANPDDDASLAAEDTQMRVAGRVFINKFASTLIYQHNPAIHLQPSSPGVSPTSQSADQPDDSSSSTDDSHSLTHGGFGAEGYQLPNKQSSITNQKSLQSVVDNFGKWTGTSSNGQPETESWIKQVPGVLTRSVLVEGSILLTNRRLCFVAYLPPANTKDIIIRSGSITFQSDGMFKKPMRTWAELRPDCVTLYKSSTKLFRPLYCLHLSEVKHILPKLPSDPKTLKLRLRTGEIVNAEFDTEEATSTWHAEFVSALFALKTHRSNKIKMMIPLRRIRKLKRHTFENMAKVMSLDVDCASSLSESLNNEGIIEGKFTRQDFDRTRIQLCYLLNCGNFDDLILDGIVRAKMEISQSGSTSNHQTPSPLFKITTIENDGEDSENEENISNHTENTNSSDHALVDKFVKEFGFEANTKLHIYPCSLLRTLPSPGHVAISKDYLCFWYRGIPVINPDYKLRVPLSRLGNLKPTSSFGFNRFGLAIETLGAPDIRLDFTSKSTREEVIEVLKVAIQEFSSRNAQRPQDSQDPPSPAAGSSAPPASYTLPACTKDPIPVLISSIGSAKLQKHIRPLRIVCLTIGSRGDVQPYISLAKRLMQDGHTVTIASHPEYRSWVESFGILYKDVGGDPGALMNFSVEHNFFSPGFFKEGLGYFKNWLNNLFMEAWIATRDSEAELLIESPSTFSGIHIAEALRIPYFRAFTMTWCKTETYPQAFSSGIDLGPSYNLLSYSLFDSLIWRAMCGQVNKWRKETLGIPSTSLEQMQAYKVPFMYNFSSAVVPKPLDWRDHVEVTGYWFLDQSHGNFQPPASLLEFIASAKNDKVPLVYIGFGSVTVPDSTAVTKSIYTAVVQAGVKAIVAKGWSDRVEAKSKKEDVTPPPEVYVLQSVPHDWLFPQMDAVCHHGGAGTTGISLRFGIPTIIHPFFGDQTFWADRVARLGAGLKIDSLSVNTLCEALKKATSDRIMKEKAGQVKEQIQAEDGPSRAVHFIYQHLDFALERTLHRIQRTQPKKSRRSKSAELFKLKVNDGAIGDEETHKLPPRRESILKRKFGRRGRSTGSEAEMKELNILPQPLILTEEPSGIAGTKLIDQAANRSSQSHSTPAPHPINSDFSPSPIHLCPSTCDPETDLHRGKSNSPPSRRKSLFSSLPNMGRFSHNRSASEFLTRLSAE
ncbi:hypothetical protein MJO29_005252 [Puccinia striiformis f. sp. tritici]|nr:hypothetical protein MJO29_005252 [Puccinia striiformis f. sp. tritici]